MEPTTERPLHLVDVAPPWESGYTVRTHGIATGQLGLGMRPAVAARPSTYLERTARQLPGGIGISLFDHVPYYRKTDSHAFYRRWIYATQWLEARHVRIPNALRRRVDVRENVWAGFVDAVRLSCTPTIVHAHSPASNFAGAQRISAALGLPTVYEVRGFWELSRKASGTGLVTMPGGLSAFEWAAQETAAARSADAVITLGTSMKDELVRRGVRPETIHIVPNGVAGARFVPPVEKDAELRARLRLKDRFVFGYVTNIRQFEGIETMLRAVGALRQQAANAAFVLVGNGPDLARLRTLVDEWRLHDAVRLVGRVPHADVARYYSLFDAFVVPRTSDPVCRIVTPLKPLEAMAMGLPTIISDLPALRELVQPGVTGWTFSPEDSGELARVLMTIMRDTERTRLVAEAGRRWVLNERQWEQMAALTANVYEEARECSRQFDGVERGGEDG